MVVIDFVLEAREAGLARDICGDVRDCGEELLRHFTCVGGVS
jgi:hypothetical protein